MILLRLIFFVFVLFWGLMFALALGGMILLKLRRLPIPTPLREGLRPKAHDDKTIEGEYRVLGEPRSDDTP